MFGHSLELFGFAYSDVAKITLGKAIHEKASLTLAEKNNAAIALGLALSGARDPLLDDTPAKVSINLSIFGTLHCFQERSVGYLLFASEPHKPCVLEHFQGAHLFF